MMQHEVIRSHSCKKCETHILVLYVNIYTILASVNFSSKLRYYGKTNLLNFVRKIRDDIPNCTCVCINNKVYKTVQEGG